VTTRSPGAQDDISRYAELLSKTRSTYEDDEFSQLSAKLKKSLVFGESPFEQMVEKAVSQVLEFNKIAQSERSATLGS
ncbi:MAG: hypothetical protein GY710_14990, partial [Desulfobacteraceae bacterium]|nr:hypothetical protein [Desulfobacteraceae bacterium]